MQEVLHFITCLFLIGIKAEVNQRYYPRYHLAPPYGWMNDPNGFSVYKNDYHLFYQFNPNSSQVPGIAHWAHAKSKDLFHWEHLPTALFPNKLYDNVGVFSGSALIENDAMYLYYTGFNGCNQVQALVLSLDGIHMFQYDQNPMLKGENRQPNLRDPKVWKHNGMYYMVLGNSFEKGNKTYGRVLLYESKDKFNWKEASIIGESDGSLGYMWECPDLFELDGKFVLLFSPQGIEPQGDSYRNLFQCGYFVGDFDYNTKVFKPITPFVELDRGHDFYATQTVLDNYGRRIVMAWFDTWEPIYPERNDGFTGMMTIPRELSLTEDNVLIQTPVGEIANIRGKNLYQGFNINNVIVPLIDKTGEILITALWPASFDVIIESKDLSAKVILSYDHLSESVSLNREGSDGERRAYWKHNGIANWQIFIDASSIELFCGEGELTFSSRFFPKDNVVVRLVSSDLIFSFVVNSLKRSTNIPLVY